TVWCIVWCCRVHRRSCSLASHQRVGLWSFFAWGCFGGGLAFARFTGGVLSIRFSASSKVIGWSETGISSVLRGRDMSNQAPFVSDWTGDAEAPARSVASASCYRGFENVRILAVVKSPSELVQVERQVFLAHVV